MNTTKHTKLKSILRAQLVGMATIDPQYYEVIRAMNFAETVHAGVSKDGKTPEFYHQISILARALTYHASLIAPCETYVAILLHDTPEDYPHFQDALQTKFPSHANNALLLSKWTHTNDGVGGFVSTKKDLQGYFDALSESPSLSIAKGLDRDNNLSRMAGVFSLDKQLSYASEAESLFLPMLKKARRLFPEQTVVYESIKSSLNIHVNAVNHYVPLLKQSQKEARGQGQGEPGDAQTVLTESKS